ncbi:MAG: phospholipid carrier-dependent glycosyltransferase [Candidatus Omnitrophota bacterium]|jgi:hypothetical protein|nr:MAG: phospholipid carrier-dependent glycosyltransferase [Candidatus Omnitrophota bacterium]
MRKKAAFFLILAVIFLSRFILVIAGQDLMGDDGFQYLTRAENYLKYGILSPDRADSFRNQFIDSPLYPILLSCFLRVLNSKIAAVRSICMLNSVFFILAACAVFFLAYRLSKKYLVALFSLAVFGMMPEGFVYSILNMPDSMFLAFFIWSNYFFVSYFGCNRWRRLALASFLLGMSVLIKPISLLFILVYVVLIISFDKNDFRRRVKIAVLCILVQMFTLSPWLIRNYHVYKEIFFSTKKDIHLYYYDYRFILEDIYGKEAAGSMIEQKAREIFSNIDVNSRDSVKAIHVLGGFAKKEIFSNFSSYATLLIKRHPRLYFGTGTVQLLTLTGDASGAQALYEFGRQPALSMLRRLPVYVMTLQLFSWILLFLIYLLSIAGLMRIIVKRKWETLVLLSLSFLYFVILVGPATHTRYRFDFSYLFAILCGFVLYEIKSSSENI